MVWERSEDQGAEENDDGQAPVADGGGEMTDLPVLSSEQVVAFGTAPFRAVLPKIAEPIVNQIRAEVAAYSGPDGGRRHQLMMMAARAAIGAYLDTSGGRGSARRKVDELFHRMGWGEAQDGNGSENLEAALLVARSAAWQQLSDHAVVRDLSAKALRDMTLALNEYTDHLRAALLRGHSMGLRNPHHDIPRARGRLFDLFASSTAGRVSPIGGLGVDAVRLERAALEAEWPVPEQAVALGVSFHGTAPELPENAAVLTRVTGNRMHVICPAAAAGQLITEIERSGTDRRIVTSWAVPTVEAGTALLWTSRTLDLVTLGVIPPTRVVRCEEHVTQLWLHAEPSMRKRLCQALLEPLLAETPNSREILSETLLVWLETRDSAPAIAARLDVHPQTVRYRWRRINELFGEALHDPEFVVQMTLVLKASVPMWKGGDQSDFELFRTNRDANQ